ncbi:unnamed protein product [Amoebophrya sp. A120]|nr:unnamed protein product [Amoebophrya sp. A120]|eukprot:GSA120T00022299001.1
MARRTRCFSWTSAVSHLQRNLDLLLRPTFTSSCPCPGLVLDFFRVAFGGTETGTFIREHRKPVLLRTSKSATSNASRTSRLRSLPGFKMSDSLLHRRVHVTTDILQRLAEVHRFFVPAR